MDNPLPLQKARDKEHLKGQAHSLVLLVATPRSKTDQMPFPGEWCKGTLLQQVRIRHGLRWTVSSVCCILLKGFTAIQAPHTSMEAWHSPLTREKNIVPLWQIPHKSAWLRVQSFKDHDSTCSHRDFVPLGRKTTMNQDDIVLMSPYRVMRLWAPYSQVSVKQRINPKFARYRTVFPMIRASVVMCDWCRLIRPRKEITRQQEKHYLPMQKPLLLRGNRYCIYL